AGPGRARRSRQPGSMPPISASLFSDAVRGLGLACGSVTGGPVSPAGNLNAPTTATKSFAWRDGRRLKTSSRLTREPRKRGDRERSPALLRDARSPRELRLPALTLLHLDRSVP